MLDRKRHGPGIFTNPRRYGYLKGIWNNDKPEGEFVFEIKNRGTFTITLKMENPMVQQMFL